MHNFVNRTFVRHRLQDKIPRWGYGTIVPAAPHMGAFEEVQLMPSTVTTRLQQLFESAKRPDGGKWTLQQVAEGTGLSVSYIWRLRSGKAGNPTQAVLEKLAAFFGVPVGYFVGTEADSASKGHTLSLEEQGVDELLREVAHLASAANLSEAERVARGAVEKARQVGSRPLIAKSLVTLARTLATAHRLAEADEAASEALGMLGGADTGPVWIRAVLTRSYIEYLQDRFARAYFHARRALAAIEVGDGDKELQFQALFHVGTIARHVGRAEEAVAYLEQARAVGEELGERYLAPVLVNLGLALLDADQPQAALEHFTKALPLFLRARLPNGVNRVQHNMGLAYERLGQWHEAIESLTKSLGSNEALGDMSILLYDHMELGWCYANIGERERALRHAFAALALAQEHDRVGDKARAHAHLGRVFAVLGDLDEATSHYEKARELLEELEVEAELPKVLLEYGDLMMKKGDTVRAAELYRKATLLVMHTPSLQRYVFSTPPLEVQEGELGAGTLNRGK